MRILFVAMSNSVHTARWINQISDRGWDIHLFPSIDLFSSPEWIHPDLRNITVYGPSVHRRPEGLDPSVRLRGTWPLRRGSGLISHPVFHRLFHRFAPWRLARIIRWLKPDIVHSIEIQHAGYLTLAASEILKGGSDIYLYGRLSEHQQKIKPSCQPAITTTPNATGT